MFLKPVQDYKKPEEFDSKLHNQKIDLEIVLNLFLHFLQLQTNLYLCIFECYFLNTVEIFCVNTLFCLEK